MPTITRSGTKPSLPCGRRRRGRSPSRRRNCSVGAPTASVSRFDIGSVKSCGTNGFRYTIEGFRQGRAEEGKDPDASRRIYFFLWGFCLVAYLASTRCGESAFCGWRSYLWPCVDKRCSAGETTSEIGLSVN
ncbi:uncharacterized protein LOC119585176 isoform X2 [Penaeus monodon]|uniref:uncharacterized protein LOC119585176 isoform X2 n=1 Tax=Penaeus monodon TaxID=6687 RepID=UPI0018A7B59E|nr:uncharacterized protein LOC119585176 isoform X2 [Penaeus monodon]